MPWRLLPLLVALPVHIAFAGHSQHGDDKASFDKAFKKPTPAPAKPTPPTWNDFLNGAKWAIARANGDMRAAEDALTSGSNFLKFYPELKPTGDAKLLEGSFARVVDDSNRVVFVGFLNGKVRIFLGSPMVRFSDPRFESIRGAVKAGVATFEKGEGVKAYASRGTDMFYEMGAFTVASMELNENLSEQQLGKLMHAIYKAAQSCAGDVADWNAR